jgi:hypothetical protein
MTELRRALALRWQRLTEQDLKRILFLSFLILLLRLPYRYLIPTFWAEDGTVFFASDYRWGPLALFQNYAGYQHLLIRIVAFFNGFLPLEIAPYGYKLSSIFVYFLLPLYAASPRVGVSVQKRAAMVLITVLLPHSGELFGNMANQMSTAGVLLLLLSSLKPAEDFFQKLADISLLFVCAMTGPYVLYLGPLVGLHLWFRRETFTPQEKRWYLSVVSVLLIAIVAQVFLIDLSGRFTTPKTDTNWESWRVAFSSFFHPLVLSGRRFPGILGDLFAVGIMVFLLRVIYGQDFSIKNWTQSRPVLWATSGFLVFASALVVSRNWIGAMHPVGMGARYYFVPYVLILWSLILSTPGNVRLKQARNYFLCFTMLSSLFYLRSTFWYQESGYWEKVQLYKTSDSMVFEINPEEWRFAVSKKECWRCR